MDIEFNNAEGLEDGMLGACGENVDVMTGYKAPKFSSAAGNEDYHNSIGSWAKGIFSKSDSGLTKDDAAKIADPNNTELSAAEMDALYKKSGSKKSFKDWYANRGQGVLDSLSSAILSADTLLGKQKDGKALETKLTTESTSGKSSTDAVTVMGMHPLTFGIVALITLSAIGFFGYKALNKKG